MLQSSISLMKRDDSNTWKYDNWFSSTQGHFHHWGFPQCEGAWYLRSNARVI